MCFDKYKYWITWNEYECVYKGDVIYYDHFEDKEYLYEIQSIYTYYGNPGCHHDRIILKRLYDDEIVETSMIIFKMAKFSLLKDGEFIENISVIEDK